MYRPYRVSKVERQAFQLSGDRIAQKIRSHQELAQDKNSYWRQAMAAALQQTAPAPAAR